MTNYISQNNLSNRQIKTLSVITTIVTILIIFVAYLPARYGKDYTGLGKKIGFSRLYQDHNEVDRKLKELEQQRTVENK